MAKHHRTYRANGRCSCGMRKHSLRVLAEHSRAKGHVIVKLPISQNVRLSGKRGRRCNI